MGIKNKFSYIMTNWLNMVIYIRDYRTDTCSLYFGYARDTHDTQEMIKMDAVHIWN